jgi:ABC-type lipoprotein release transport system permease subunit
MKSSRLLFRNLTFFWRTNLAVVLGVATAVGVLSGALVVGESVRASLRNLVLQRLGKTDYLLSANRFFREELPAAMASTNEFRRSFSAECPLISLEGVVINEKTGQRAHKVNVYGIDQRFWKFHDRHWMSAPEKRDALLGQNLAAELSIQLHDPILVRIEKQEGIPRESLFGRKDDTGRTVRLVCSGMVPSSDLGEFSLRSNPSTIRSIFVPLTRLQADLDQEASVNAVLISARDAPANEEDLRGALRASFNLEDLGLKLQARGTQSAVYLESDRIVLEDPLARAALETASQTATPVSGVYTYLANSIRAGHRSIPYSVITAVDLFQGSMPEIRLVQGTGAAGVNDDSIWLNQWAKDRLAASPGDVITIDYYLWETEGRLVTRSADFHLAGIIALQGDAADPALAPDFPGITEKSSLSDWDPPFPVDLDRIRPEDEEYWDRYKTVPKAFISLSKGQELWQTRFGSLTAIRLRPADDQALESYKARLREKLDPEASGLTLTAVKGQGLKAATGATDFGEYFVYFSFFLIAGATLLAALFFRLGVEQRIQEIGTLTAAGFAAGRIRKLFLLEGLILSAAGSMAGVAVSLVYAKLLLVGLQSSWAGTIGMRRLFLHLSWTPFLIGSLAGIVAAILSVALTLKGVAKNSPRAMLAGVLESRAAQSRRGRAFGFAAILTWSLGFLVLAGSSMGVVPETGGFFGAGSLLLAALLSSIALGLRRDRRKLLAGRGWPALFHLGTRNAGYRPGRSLLCISLIASATFVIVSVEAFRHDPEKISMDKSSGTGGFPLYAESVLPVLHDLNTAAGKEALSLSSREAEALEGVGFTQFRLRPGDDASCLNLYAPQEPRILGAPKAFLTAGRFSFQDHIAGTPEENRNPWLLLDTRPGDAIVPAIGDANTIRYILQRSLGEEIVIRRPNGESIRLRLVAALKDSLLQGELLISEENFLRFFPEQEGYRFFMIDAPLARAVEVTRTLEEGLADLGFDVSRSRDRLAAYHRVENTYLSTFQSLGGLGLVLGTIGLATVLLRNVIERRPELALLRAVGFRRKALAGLIVAENALLMLLGLLAGSVCALVAIAPALMSRGATVPVAPLLLTLGAVLIVGLGASAMAALAAFRAPLLPALRGE